MTSWDTKVPQDPNSSAGAIKASINKPGSSEPDDMPRSLAEIHKDLGKHLPPTDLKEGEEDWVGEPVGSSLEVAETRRDTADGRQHWQEMKRRK